jgi:hypothetical protein
VANKCNMYQYKWITVLAMLVVFLTCNCYVFCHNDNVVEVECLWWSGSNGKLRKNLVHSFQWKDWQNYFHLRHQNRHFVLWWGLQLQDATDAPGAAALRMVAVVILCPMNCTQIVVHQPGSSWTFKLPQTTGWTRRDSNCKTDLRPVLTICYCIIPHATHTHKVLHTMHVECYHQVNSRLKRKLCLLLPPCYHFWCHHQTPCEP